MRNAILVEETPEVAVRREMVHFTAESFGDIAMHVTVCRAMYQRITEALVTFDTKPTAQIHSIRKRKPH